MAAGMAAGWPPDRKRRPGVRSGDEAPDPSFCGSGRRGGSHLGQIAGGPDWLSTQRLDISARAEGNPSPDAMTTMLEQLLADRFVLKVHTEQREVDVCARYRFGRAAA
jgi:hypothetical protein